MNGNFVTRSVPTLALLIACLGWRAAASNYFTESWQTDDGLPQNAVTAIVQTRDGFLWVGTYSGLARFDGDQFVTFDNNNTPQMHSSRVTSLFEDDSGVLWIGHETGEVTRYQEGKFEAVKAVPGWGGRKIVSISADESGDVWLLGSDGNLGRVRDGLILSPQSGDVPEMVSLARGQQGELWVFRNGRVSRLDHGKAVPVPFPPETDAMYIQGICASNSGGLWVASNGRLREWRENHWVRSVGPVPWGAEPALTLLEMRNGNIAAGNVEGGLGIVATNGESFYFTRTNGLPSDWVRALFQDREGDLWVGTGSGLVALREGKVASINPPDQWQARTIQSVTASRDGSLWVGTEGAGLYHFKDGAWTRFGTSAGISNLFVWAVSEDKLGRMWVGTWGGGLFVQNGNQFERPPGLETVTTPMVALLHAADGSTWVGTGSGLMHYRDGAVDWYGTRQGLALPDVRAVVQQPDGTVWFGMLGGGLGRLKDGHLRQFRKTDGLSSDFIQALRLDDDGALWIGTFGGGLDRLKDGKFSVINTAQGLPNSVICDIEDDGRGDFWFSSHGGIFRASKADLNRCADGRIQQLPCERYTKGDGLPTLECSGGFQPAGCRTPDGRLWFPTTKGLASVDPGEIKQNRLPPPVVIESLLVDNRLIPVPERPGTSLQIPPGRHRVEIRYTGLSFVNPDKVQFKYQLEGLDPDWVDAGTKRSANYSYIPPGDYTFHVSACNNDGLWNPGGAEFSFVLLPYFWQTNWFHVLAGILIVAAVAGGVWFEMRRRMRLKLERIERQRAVERERERIAKDIHDDLGASLTRITMLSQLARSELDTPSRATGSLDRIYGTARELTRAMDEIVWAVNPRHDTVDSLASYLGRFAQDFLSAADIRCRLDLPLQLPAWPLTAELRHNLFLAFKEALHNAVKHAGATKVRISLAFEPGELALTIEDNGRGLSDVGDKNGSSPNADRVLSGQGIPNMRRRLAEIGGRCEIESVSGQGTFVKFLVPVRKGFAESPPRKSAPL